MPTPLELAVIAVAKKVIAETPADATGEAAWTLAEARELAGLSAGTMRDHLIANPPAWLLEGLREAQAEAELAQCPI